jgi:long-subunit acyl-CoA synthetase (AMP-forming)
LAEKIAKHASSAEAAFGSPIDWVLIGGAPLSRRVYENLCSLGVQPLTAYGLTETTALYSIATVGDDPHVGSAGRACDLPGVEVKVSDDGVLLVKGPNVMKGYYRDPEGTAQVLSPDGWFRTDDYGRIDEDGYVWVTGRASRTIVLSSGKKIAPEELEERIHALPGVREVLVSGDGATRNITAEIYAVVPEDSVRRSISCGSADQTTTSLPLFESIRARAEPQVPAPRTPIFFIFLFPFRTAQPMEDSPDLILLYSLRRLKSTLQFQCGFAASAAAHTRRAFHDKQYGF